MDHSDGSNERSAYYYHIDGRTKNRRLTNQQSRFAEFPAQLTANNTNSTPQIVSNERNELPQSRIRFADDTKSPQSRVPKNRVLVLTSRNNDLQSTSMSSPLQADTLNFSMITTPGGGKARGMHTHNNHSTPSDNTETLSAISSGIWTTATPFTNLLRGVVNKKLIATPNTSARETLTDNELIQNQDKNGVSALSFARSAPLSGYLRKMGTNIPTFKRRFFVLKPSTHLYYFLSPTDAEPRGCIDLESGSENGGCEVKEVGVLPDGTFRFELLFDYNVDIDEDNTGNNSQRQSIVLEARTEEIGREWINKLQTERLSAARDEIDFFKTSLAEVTTTSSRWEKVAAQEESRADEAEEKFICLNEAVGLLRVYIADGNSDSLAQSVAKLNLNGTNFISVSEAVETIHGDYKLACETAEDERKRADGLAKKLKEAKSQLSKVEAELSRVWQDNCAIRKELKKSKREKKILIREVRAQRAKSSEDSLQNQESVRPESSCTSTEQSLPQKQDSKCGDSETASLQPKQHMNTEQQKLVFELEEHVMSGLRLSEQFLTLNGIEPSVVGDDIDSCMHMTQASLDRNTHHPLNASGVPTKMSSLLDDDSNDDTTINDEDEGEDLKASNKEIDAGKQEHVKESPCNAHNNNSSVHTSSVQHIPEAQAPQDPYLYYKQFIGEKQVNQNLNDRFIEVCSPNPIENHTNTFQTYDNSINQAPTSAAVVSTASGSSNSRIMDTGHATSKLECHLTDAYPPGSDYDGEIYHITFYSSKIGLQFQKVPVEKNSGLLTLTDAMTSDLGSNRTVSDLQRIAAISHNSKADITLKSMECPPVPPIDMVLICGFVGFDESTGNTRPRIGARLVAFDGITVEVGQWTFESIRKSIQARGRPLTLSFRNDFLSDRQQVILTKAVRDVQAHDKLTPLSNNIFRSSNNEAASVKSNMIISKSSSVSSNSHKYYSLSEHGGSIASTVAPLVSNLMSGLSLGEKKQEKFTPDYLHRQSSSLDEMRHHQDFKSKLL